MATHVLRVPVSTGDTSLTTAVRDDLIAGDSGGVRFIADLGFGWSYPAGNLPRPAPATPASNALVRDVSENADGYTRSISGTTYQGGGFDFTNAVANEVGIEIPASVNANIYTNQEYLFCVYMKLPALADWNPDGVLAAMVTSALQGTTYQNGVESFLIAQQRPTATNGILNCRFQNNTGTVSPNLTLSLPSGTDFYDSAVVQIAVWTDGANAHVRAKTVTQEMSTSGAFTGNALDFSALPIRVGGSPSGFPAVGNKSKYRVYRAFVENLNTSGRNPVTVLDADLLRVNARNVFS